MIKVSLNVLFLIGIVLCFNGVNMQKEEDEKLGIANDFFWTEGEDPETLPYETLDEFDQLKENKPFPTDFDEEFDNEIDEERKKRNVANKLWANFLPNEEYQQKIDKNIKETPLVNSKFHGINL
ncbi:CLUMA_CG013404, isoform A [Clunio marinus]|uniref:CLUMA_CG013404, isoform A n=1 Tax=Clunio marinus TaxID=568069 RepID=A0A1J1IKQ3_9DIPT|nr:CLUMA_CG013404, isoform A [Clunio marinus]